MSSPVAQVTTPDQTDPNSTQLYINNLSFSTTPEALTNFLASKLGAPPSHVNIVINRYNGKSKGFGFVRIPKEKLQAALALNGATLDDREMGIVEARERTEEEKQAQREKRDARRREMQQKRKEERAAANAASAANTASPANVATSTGEPSRPRRPRAERKVHENATQLYVSNLSYDITKERLQEVVNEAIGGEVLEIDILISRVGKFKGKSRGYGFLTVPNDKLDKALALNGKELEGRQMSVVIAREREKKPEAEDQVQGGGDAAPANGDAKEAPRRRRAPRRRGPKTNGGEAPESKDAEGAAAAAVQTTTVAAGSSAPTPDPSTMGTERRNQPKKPRKPKNAAAGAPAVDVGGGAVQ